MIRAATEVLEGAFSARVVVGKLGELPPRAFDVVRQQYVSDGILAWLVRSTVYRDYDAIVGLLDADAYTPGLNFVFGQALPSGRVCAVYLARLKPEFYGENPDELLLSIRVAKEVLHEVGHLFGLGHCDNPLCVMHFSNSVVDTDIKKAKFCANCAKRLGRLGVEVRDNYILR